MPCKDQNFLRPSSSMSGRSGHSVQSTSSSSTGLGGGFSGFLSSLARTVSNASSSHTSGGMSSSNSSMTKWSRGHSLAGGREADRSLAEYDPAREPIKAFLRIRPPLSPSRSSGSHQPYIQVLDDTVVSLSTASDFNQTSSNTAPVFKFTRVFDGSTVQGDFFQHTTLPMVADVLAGSNALLFTYGVSNSGKTYTVQGTPGEPGLLPRTFDVLFNSIQGKMSTCQFRPSGLSSVELIPPYERSKQSVASLGIQVPSSSSETAEKTSISLGEHHQYAIWCSYAEVYNEKAFDLLDGSIPTATSSTSSSGNTSFAGGSLGLGFSGSRLLPGSTVKRKALSIKSDKSSSSGKYISGLKEVRVFSAQEARAVLRRGQQSRRVFSTLLNRSSSRSHGIFTIKIVRNLDGCEARDVKAASVSTFSVVDLAGSERISNTGTTGDRLREAGNINKSLMVLGQCMEVLRRNQECKERNKKPAVVPFRHSKLTELFQSYFTGEGRVSMIVNVNPYDTGMEENIHVMKFASVARQVVTLKSTPAPPPPAAIPAAPPAEIVPAQTKTQHVPSSLHPNKSTAASETDEQQQQPQSPKPFVGDITVEEQEPDDTDGDTDEGEDQLVAYLFDLVEEQRQEIYELKLKTALASVQSTQDLHDTIAAKLQENDAAWNKRLQDVITRQEEKANAKIEILTQAYEAQLAAMDEEEEEEQEQDNSDDEGEPSSSDESVVLATRKP